MTHIQGLITYYVTPDFRHTNSHDVGGSYMYIYVYVCPLDRGLRLWGHERERERERERESKSVTYMHLQSDQHICSK